jgi:hypothetical protein
VLSTVSWVGGSGDWDTASNWSGGQVPGPADDAVIAAAGAKVTHAATAYDQVKSLTLGAGAGVTLELTAGTLGVVNATFNANTVSVKGSSTLMVHGQATSAGHFEVVDPNATFSGEGTLTSTADGLWTAGVVDADWTVASGGTLTISGDKNKVIRGTLTNSGTVLWQGTGKIGVSSLTVINNLASGLWVCQNDTPFLFRNDDGFAVHPFNNYGTFRKQGGVLQTAFDSFGLLNNYGRVEVLTGSLLVAGGGANYGTFDVAQGADLQFITFNVNYYLEAGTTFEGSGKVWITTGGTLSVDVPVTVANPFEVNTGTLRGAGPLTATTGFVWSGGMVSGNVVIGPQATMSITGTLSMIMKGALTNYGHVTWSAPGPMGVSARSVITNQPGAVFEIQNDQLLEFHEDDGFAPWTFTNGGTVVKSIGSGTSTINDHTLFLNSGTVQVQSGTLFFDGPYFTPLTGNTLAGGTFLLAGTLMLQQGADIQSNGATLVLDGPNGKIVDKSGADALAHFAHNLSGGTLDLKNGRTLTTEGPLTNQGWVSVDAGSTLTIPGTYSQSLGKTTVQDGTLVATLVNLQGGYLNGFGTVQAAVHNAALVHVGTDETTGILTVDGDYTQTTGGTLITRIGGLAPGAEFDQLQVTGTAHLAGTIGVSLLGTYVPDPGDTFRVVLATAADGVFSKVRGEGKLFDLLYDTNGLTLQWPETGRHSTSRLSRPVSRLRSR